MKFITVFKTEFKTLLVIVRMGIRNLKCYVAPVQRVFRKRVVVVDIH